MATIGTAAPVNVTQAFNSGGLTMNGPSTQTSSSQSVGVKAATPANNIPKPATTLPKSQVSPVKDLSGTYANVGGTIYNTQSQTKFANPQDFFKDSGQSDFNNLKFNTNYTPTGSETIYGQPQPTAPQAQTPQAGANSNAGGLMGGLINSAQQQQPEAATTQAPASQYTPPNQGTTGVSQGGIVGNLVNYAQNESPEVTKARQDLQDLEKGYATQTANIEGSPIDLSLATGQEGILNRLFAAKQGAAQTALSSALTSQGQQIGATTSAGQLNAPVIANPGQVQVSPSQPTPGSTTSGATNLNSLIGQRSIPGQAQKEFYNTATGAGFSSPQQLADFVNQQMPGSNATAQNVFQLLQQQGQGGSNILGGNSALNPISQIPSLAQKVASGQMSYADAISAGGSTPGFTSALQAAISQAAPGFNFNAAQGASAAQQSNAQIGGTAAVTAGNAAFQQANTEYLRLANQVIPNIENFGNLLTQGAGGINPFSSTYANRTWGDFKKNLSDSQWSQFQSTFQQLQKSIGELASTGGSNTPTANTEQSKLTLDPNASISTIKDVLQRIAQEGVVYLNGQGNLSNAALNQAKGGSSNSSSGTAPGGFGWNGA